MTNTDELPGWTHVYSGKVRDLYVPTKLLDDDDSWTGDPLHLSPVLLVVASDRVSAFDHVLEPAIPGKGAMLTRAQPVVVRPAARRAEPLGVPPRRPPREARAARGAGLVAERAMLVPHARHVPDRVRRARLPHRRRLEGVPAVAVPSAASRCPPGSRTATDCPSRCTPPRGRRRSASTTRTSSYERTVELVGEVVADAIAHPVDRIFERAAAIAEGRGLILADTKFEFGADRDPGI